MSRPRKYNADWFKHSNNLRLDEKIQVLLNEYGVAGYGIHIATMELLTGSDHHKVKLNPIDIRVFASSIRAKAEQINQVWDLLKDLGLYTIKTTETYTQIEYKNLTDELGRVLRKREVDREATKKDVVQGSEVSDTENKVNETETPINETETPINDTEKPQRKREKENKSKKLEKEREREVKNPPSIFNLSLLNDLFIKHKIVLLQNHVNRPTDLQPLADKFLSFQAKKQKTWPTEKDCIEHFEKWLPSELKTLKPTIKLPNIYAKN